MNKYILKKITHSEALKMICASNSKWRFISDHTDGQVHWNKESGELIVINSYPPFNVNYYSKDQK